MSDAADAEVEAEVTRGSTSTKRGSMLFKPNRDPFFDALFNIFDYKERGRDAVLGFRVWQGWVGPG